MNKWHYNRTADRHKAPGEPRGGVGWGAGVDGLVGLCIVPNVCVMLLGRGKTRGAMGQYIADIHPCK